MPSGFLKSTRFVQTTAEKLIEGDDRSPHQDTSPHSTFSVGGGQASHRRQAAEEWAEYDDFNASQIIQLVTQYLMSVINKHMEMQQLTITRQRLMQMRQYKFYREKVDEKYEELEMYFKLHKERSENHIKMLKERLATSRSESDRLRAAVEARDEDIKVLSSKTGDLGHVQELFTKVEGTLAELEERGQSNAAGGKMIKGFLDKIDKLRERKKREAAERLRDDQEDAEERETEAKRLWDMNSKNSGSPGKNIF